jgi:hypothetical protein
MTINITVHLEAMGDDGQIQELASATRKITGHAVIAAREKLPWMIAKEAETAAFAANESWEPYGKDSPPITVICRGCAERVTLERVRCDSCLAAAQSRLDQVLTNVRNILSEVMYETKCKECGETVWYEDTDYGKERPYTIDGSNHLENCPGDDRMKK